MQRQWEGTVEVAGLEEWEEIYLRPYLTSRETKLQSFQFRVNHRLITCNALLRRYRIKADDNCTICDCTDTIEHFFLSCPPCKGFWNSLFHWVNAATSVDLTDLGPKELLLGVQKDFPKAKQINFFLLSARFFIHRQRLFHNCDLSMVHWIRELRDRLITEQRVCRAEGRASKFDHWLPVLRYTGL